MRTMTYCMIMKTSSIRMMIVSIRTKMLSIGTRTEKSNGRTKLTSKMTTIVHLTKSLINMRRSSKPIPQAQRILIVNKKMRTVKVPSTGSPKPSTTWSQRPTSREMTH